MSEAEQIMMFLPFFYYRDLKLQIYQSPENQKSETQIDENN
jgi:hypothetical protein